MTQSQVAAHLADKVNISKKDAKVALEELTSLVVRELLVRQRPVVAIVRDAAKAREVFGAPDGLRVRSERAAVRRGQGGEVRIDARRVRRAGPRPVPPRLRAAGNRLRLTGPLGPQKYPTSSGCRAAPDNSKGCGFAWPG